MKQPLSQHAKELFPVSDIVRMDSFKTIGIWDSHALLAKANHTLAMSFAISRGKSALLGAKDCFECLSPHKKAA